MVIIILYILFIDVYHDTVDTNQQEIVSLKIIEIYIFIYNL